MEFTRFTNSNVGSNLVIDLKVRDIWMNRFDYYHFDFGSEGFKVGFFWIWARDQRPYLDVKVLEIENCNLFHIKNLIPKNETKNQITGLYGCLNFLRVPDSPGNYLVYMCYINCINYLQGGSLRGSWYPDTYI